ncbi:hypothetical protein ACPB9E_14790 [Streptomyces exfoliatus]|uniref:hypothetical protein n=1 Tax=Streptomyces exfoliatus TaxID=1905 RepID=UPI003C2B06CD
MRRTSASVSTVLALGLLLSACGSGEEEPPQAVQQCDETLSPTAVGALESVLGTKEFHSEGTGLERTVNVLVEDQARAGRQPGHPDMCEVIADSSPHLGVKIDFRVYEDADRFDDGAKWTADGRYLYGMGREASANNRTADLFVGCSSSRLKGAEEEPAPIAGSLRFDKPVKGAYPANTSATREAYLTVLHSVTLAVVKELGCENNAGLPEKPVFEEKKWRGEQ